MSNRFKMVMLVALLASTVAACTGVEFGSGTVAAPAPTMQTGELSEALETALKATLELPATLPNGESVNLTFILVNDGDEVLFVLKWYTPLEGLAGEIFRVERDGQDIPYEGILATRGTPLSSDYVLLGAGESVSGDVDLATTYDFSAAGDYTVEFISPRISHVARSEADMAKTMDDLGPVQIPSNRVRVKIVNSLDLSVRRTPPEATAMIRDHPRSQRPDLNPDFHLSLEELSAP
jgi:peptidyl-Lys metalloendopeptidase